MYRKLSYSLFLRYSHKICTQSNQQLVSSPLGGCTSTRNFWFGKQNSQNQLPEKNQDNFQEQQTQNKSQLLAEQDNELNINEQLNQDQSVDETINQLLNITEDALDEIPTQSTGIIQRVAFIISGFHEFTGLPWWLVFPVWNILLRAALFPLQWYQMNSMSINSIVLRQARQNISQRTQQNYQFEPQTKQNQSRLQDFRELYSEVLKINKQINAPWIVWAIASPLVQIPVFILNIWTVRYMCVLPWEGIPTGGTLWFPDLSAHAIDWTNLTFGQEMGKYGTIFPIYMSAIYYVISQSIIDPKQLSAGAGTQTYKMFVLFKLFALWLTLPLFVSSLGLPQGALIYWSTSMTFTFLLSTVLRQTSVRQFLRIGRIPVEKYEFIPIIQTFKFETNVPKDVIEFVEKTEDVKDLLTKAADLKLKNQMGGAFYVIEKLKDKFPEYSRTYHILGDLHHSMQNYYESEKNFKKCLALEQDKLKIADTLAEMGIMQVHSGRREEGLETLKKSIQIFEGNARAWIALSQVYFALGDKKWAQYSINKARKINPQLIQQVVEFEKKLISSRV